MSTTEAIVSIVSVLFGAGGALAIYVNARWAKRPSVTTNEAKQTTIEQISQDLGIEGKYKEYAEDMQVKMDDRNDDTIKTLESTRRSLGRVIDYAGELRDHIFQEKGPPPPKWPKGIH